MALSKRLRTFCQAPIMRVRCIGAKTLVAAIAMILALTLWPAVYSSWSVHYDLGFSWRVLVFSSLFVVGVFLWGLLPITIFASARKIWNFPLIILAGNSLLGAGLVIMAFLLPVTPRSALLFLVLSGGVMTWVSAKKIPDFFSPLQQTSSISLVAVCVGLVAASGWSQTYLFAFEDAGQSVIYGPWKDGFALAQIAALFSDRLQPQTLGWFDLAGVDVGFYHFGPYAVAGAFSGITSAPGLSAIDAFIIPWGFFLLSMSAFALGWHWWGPRLGLASQAAASMLPDASFYGFKHAWFGYYWLLLASPSLAWGVAPCTCAILLVDAACRRAKPSLFFLGLCSAAITILYKAHFVVIVFPLLLLWALISFPGIRRRNRAAIIILCGILFVVLFQLARYFNFAPTIAFGHDWGTHYLQYIGGGVEGEGAQQLWRQIVASKWIILKVVVVLVASFGVLPVIWLFTISVRLARQQPTISGFLPLIFLVIHLAMVLGLGENTRGNPWELHHRPFILVYFLLAAWCGGSLLMLLRQSDRSRWWTLVVIPLLAFPLLFGNQVRGEGIWFSKHFLSTPISKDWLACADLIRRHSERTDVVQTSDNDPLGITGALTERAAYLARPGPLSKMAAFSPVVKARGAEMMALSRADTTQAFEHMIERLPIRWYVMKPDAVMLWPADIISKPVFQCGAYRVYDLDMWRR